MQTPNLVLGLSANKDIHPESVSLIYHLLTVSPGPRALCEEALPQLFKSPAAAWAFVDTFGEACLRAYIEACHERSELIDRTYRRKLAEGTKTGFEIAISAFYLAKRYDITNNVKLLKAPDPEIGTIKIPEDINVTSDVKRFDDILTACRLHFGSQPPAHEGTREGLIAGTSSGIILLAQRHADLVASFDRAEIDEVEVWANRL
jgi:hypothetical protein